VTDHQVCSKNNTTGGTRGAGTVYPSGAPDFNPFSVGFVLLDYWYLILKFLPNNAISGHTLREIKQRNHKT
jgi:hypothetical protein